MEPSLVALDTECAVTRGAPHLVEVGAVRFRAGEAVDWYESLVRPEVPIEPEARAVHGLDDADVRDAPPAGEVLRALAAWLGDEPLVAHDARRDAWVLGFECRRHGIEGPDNPLLDSLALARRAFPALEDHSLSSVAEHLGLDAGGRHRALVDATLVWQLVEACAQVLGLSDVPGLRAACGVGTTVRRAAPVRPGRRPALVRQLERAAAESAAVRLAYGRPRGAASEADGGPAATLLVQPRLVYQVKGRAYLEAECLSSGTLKTYRLDRVLRARPAP